MHEEPLSMCLNQKWGGWVFPAAPFLCTFGSYGLANTMNMLPDKKLVLIDAYALIYRSYYAFFRNPMFNAEGMNTSPVLGFVNALEEVFAKLKPSHIGVAFDGSGPTFRHKMYPEYKANRQETPDDIRKAVPVIKQILEAYRIPVLQCPLFEADDIIGTFARKASEKGFGVYMVTPDKDYMQLVDERVFMYKPAKSGNGPEILGPKEVCESMGLQLPEQFIDVLALMGDASDNIPGAFGIGEKGALKLVQQFGSVEKLYEQLDEVSGKLKEKLIESRDRVFLSKQLARICTEVPLLHEEAEFVYQEPDYEKLFEWFGRLQFRDLRRKVEARRGQSPGSPAEAASLPEAGPAPAVSSPKTSIAVVTHGQYSLFPGETAGSSSFNGETASFSTHPDEPATGMQQLSDIPHRYTLLTSGEPLEPLLQALTSAGEFVFDTETTSLNPLDAELVGIAFSVREGEAWYLSFPADRAAAQWIADRLRPVFEDKTLRKVGQNLKYDLSVLRRYGIEVRGELFDTMLAHYLLHPEQRHNMQVLAEKYLHYTPIPIETLIGDKGKGQRSMRDVDPEKVSEYAGEDADVTLRLYHILRRRLEEESLLPIAAQIEMPLVSVLSDMECEGVRLDIVAMNAFAVDLRNDLLTLESQIYEAAGTEFNISSPQQLGVVLFEQLKIMGSPKKTKTKQYSTSEEVLQSLAALHPIIDLILDYRGLKKLLSTYADALPKLVHPQTGRIHTSFNQAVTSTGRLSSTDPNLQNIPIREERGRALRKAFVARDKDHYLLSADYSQVELRLMAHMSGDENMIKAFLHQEDIHASTAAKIFSVPLEEVTRDMRRQAKTANFGIIYGISGFGLAQRLRIPRNEAQALINGYFRIYPQVQRYMMEAVESARKQGFVETLFGRRRFIPEIHSRNANLRGMAERNAINAPIQGSAADLIKMAMIRIWERFRELKLQARMILQVHDELLFDVPFAEKEQVEHIVKHEMEQVYPLKIPLLVEMGSGMNWLEAH